MKEIHITKGKVTLVDDEDYERVSAHKWYAQNNTATWYAYRTIRTSEGKKSIALHRFVLELDANEALHVDHKNGDGLDNTKANLRLATNQQNCANVGPKHKNKTSHYKGVYLTSDGTYEAQIKIDYKSHNIGRSVDEMVAARYYDAVASFHFGKFAFLNFPDAPATPLSLADAKNEMRNLKARPVGMFDQENKLINQWQGVPEAAKELGLCPKNLLRIIGGQKSRKYPKNFFRRICNLS